MKKGDILISIFNIREEEKPIVFLMLTYSFCIGVGLYIYYTAATTLFLTKFTGETLPVAYIAGGCVLFIVAKANSSIQKHLTFPSLTIMLLVLLSVSLLALLLCYSLTLNKWIIFLLFLWIRVNLFVFSYTFWVLASKVFNLGQAKRLYSLIGTGEVLASLVANLIVKILISERIVEVETLLFIALGFIVLSIFIINTIINKNKHRLSEPSNNSKMSAIGIPSASKNYSVFMYLLGLIPIACLYIIEFNFSIDSKTYFPDKDQLAIFLGQFLLSCSIIELLVKGILFRFVTNTYGVMSGLMLMPISLIIISVILLLMSTFSLNVFFLVLISRFLITSVRRAFSDTSFQLLYQPIPYSESAELQNKVETYAKPLGYVVAGGVLIILTRLNYSNNVTTYLFLTGLLSVWVILAFLMQKEYKQTLLNIIFSIQYPDDKKINSKIESQIIINRKHFENLSFEEIVKLTQSSQSDQREKAAFLLGESGRYFAFKYIIKLLEDKHVPVRIAAIQSAAIIARHELIPYLLIALESPQLKTTAKEALCRIGEPIINHISTYFDQYEDRIDTVTELIELVESIGGFKAIRFLRTKIAHPSLEIAKQVMTSLLHLGYKPNVGEQSYLYTQVDSTVNTYLWILAAENDLKNTAVGDSVVVSLKGERKKSMLMLITILSFLCSNKHLEKIPHLIYSSKSHAKSYLSDLVNLLVMSNELNAKITPLFENISDYEILMKYERQYPQQNLPTELRLLTIINKSSLSVITKSLALKQLLEFRDENSIKILAASIKTNDILLSETALYGLSSLDPTRFEALKTHFIVRNDLKYIELCEKVQSFKDETDLTISKIETDIYSNRLVT